MAWLLEHLFVRPVNGQEDAKAAQRKAWAEVLKQTPSLKLLAKHI
jgi:hypothetical protein